MAPVLFNDFKAQWSAIRDQALAAFDRVGKSGWLILGEEVRAFEAALAAYWQIEQAIGCANGLDAIEIALRCLGIQRGDKVLTTPLSAFATTLAILRAGAQPVFVDTDAAGLIDLDKAEKALTAHPDIRFMVVVHLYGQALNLSRLEQLRDRFDLRLVEDCAQAIGASHNGRMVGSVGQLAATSFYPTKNLGAYGDGGALLTAIPELADRARCLRDYGQSKKYVHTELGLNSRLDEVHAAILRDALLPVLDRMTERRGEIAASYQKGIVNKEILWPDVPGSQSVWHLFPILIRADRRDSFLRHASEQGIQTGLHYPQLITEQKALTDLGKPIVFGTLDHALHIAQSEVSLPIHPYVSASDIERVIHCCNSWAG